MISIIAAIDQNYGIGKNNQLLWHLPADLQHFKSLTLGKPIIMGKSTYDSIGKPLVNRMNIVLSKQSLCIEGVLTVNSITKALNLAKNAAEIMIIGGESIYRQTLDLASNLYITWISHTFVEADKFFPPIDMQIWRCKEHFDYAKDYKNQHAMRFCHYVRNCSPL